MKFLFHSNAWTKPHICLSFAMGFSAHFEQILEKNLTNVGFQMCQHKEIIYVGAIFIVPHKKYRMESHRIIVMVN